MGKESMMGGTRQIEMIQPQGQEEKKQLKKQAGSRGQCQRVSTYVCGVQERQKNENGNRKDI